MRKLLAILLLATAAPGAIQAAPPLHTLWVAHGAHNTVTLLGSIHMLRPGESAVPDEAVQALEHARALVLEIDLNAVDAQAMGESALALGLLPGEQTLARTLGTDLYAKFSERAQALGLQPATLARFQPWLAALMLDQAQLAQLGFASDAGVDVQFAHRAAVAHTPVIGLETVAGQFGLFAHLTPAEQRRYMSYTLAEQAHAGQEIDAIVTAWRTGDAATLERLLGEGASDFPELFQVLTTDRNRRWLQVIGKLLADDGDYLVVVGAMHLVGKDGLVALLQEQGYSVEQH